MRGVRIGLGLVLAVVVLLAGLGWATWPKAGHGQLVIPAKTSFAKGHFSLYAQPWGGELVRWTQAWSRHADAMVVNQKRFPAGTEVTWRWPPIAPRNGPGVWGYDQVSFGNYDGGLPEHAIEPIRVRDLKALAQRFRWTIGTRWGDGNVLTEFYLRTSTTDVEAKRLEIGWFLHAPASTRGFFDSSKLVGTYRDEHGRRWTVRIVEKYCMFAPEQPGDVATGSIDMLRAMRWLHGHGLVRGDDWFWGAAIGLEPVRGVGTFTLDQWQVERR